MQFIFPSCTVFLCAVAANSFKHCVCGFILCNVSMISCLREILVPLCVKNNTVPSTMCYYLALKFWSMQKNVTFDSAELKMIVIPPVHSNKAVCAHAPMLAV